VYCRSAHLAEVGRACAARSSNAGSSTIAPPPISAGRSASLRRRASASCWRSTRSTIATRRGSIRIARRGCEALPQEMERGGGCRGEHGAGEPRAFPPCRIADRAAHHERASHAERSDQRPRALIGAAAPGGREPRHARRYRRTEYHFAEAVHDGADEKRERGAGDEREAAERRRDDRGGGAEEPEWTLRLDARRHGQRECRDQDAVCAKHQADVAL